MVDLFQLMVDLFDLMVDYLNMINLIHCTETVSSSILPSEYPKRRYPVGKVPLLKKSMHHNCQLGDFEKVFEAIGEDVYNDIMNNH